MKRVVFLLLFLPSGLFAQKRGRLLIDSLLKVAPAMSEDTIKAEILILLAANYTNYDPDTAISFGKEAIELSQNLQWQRGIGQASYHVGFNYYNKSNYPKALEYLFKSLAASETAEDETGAGNAMRKIGNVYRDEKLYTEALDYYYKALKLFGKNKDKLGMARCYSNIGEIHFFEHRDSAAMGFHRMALQIQQEIGYVNGEVITYYRMADIYRARKDYKASLACNLKAVEISRDPENVVAKEQIQEALGEAGECYLDIAKDQGNNAGINRDAAIAEALHYLGKAIAVAGEMGHLTDIAIYYGYLSEANALSGDLPSAYNNLLYATQLKDSIFSANRNKTITSLETEREKALKKKIVYLEQVKKRNERLAFASGMIFLALIAGIIYRNFKKQIRNNTLLSVEKQKVEIRTQELTNTLSELKRTQEQLIYAERLKENETTRSRISQDIHDEVGAELTRISWVSELARTRAKGGTLSEIAGFLDKIAYASRETTQKLGEIIWATNPEHDSLDSMLVYIRSYVAKFLEDTDLKYSITVSAVIPAIPINPELKRNLFLIVKEALHNTIKHSGAGEFLLTFEVENDEYSLTIKDNGKGMAENTGQNGNGLKNMRKRMEDVSGTFELTSSRKSGTLIVLRGRIY